MGGRDLGDAGQRAGLGGSDLHVAPDSLKVHAFRGVAAEDVPEEEPESGLGRGPVPPSEAARRAADATPVPRELAEAVSAPGGSGGGSGSSSLQPTTEEERAKAEALPLRQDTKVTSMYYEWDMQATALTIIANDMLHYDCSDVFDAAINDYPDVFPIPRGEPQRSMRAEVLRSMMRDRRSTRCAFGAAGDGRAHLGAAHAARAAERLAPRSGVQSHGQLRALARRHVQAFAAGEPRRRTAAELCVGSVHERRVQAEEHRRSRGAHRQPLCALDVDAFYQQAARQARPPHRRRAELPSRPRHLHSAARSQRARPIRCPTAPVPRTASTSARFPRRDSRAWRRGEDDREYADDRARARANTASCTASGAGCCESSRIETRAGSRAPRWRASGGASAG